MHRYTISPHPPSFDSQPWFPLIVRIEGFSSTISTSDLASQMVTQLQSLATSFQVRLQSVRVWGALVAFTSPGPMQPLTVRVHDPLSFNAQSTDGPQSTTSEVITDYPDLMSRARVGFRYSSAQYQRAIVVGGAGAGSRMLTISGGGPNSVVYFKLVWRPNSSSVPQLSNETEEIMSITSESDSEVLVLPYKQRVQVSGRKGSSSKNVR
jgi:hypothetical protein